ncbi:MAG: hypothetical protein HC887_01815 [Desulfobacteraceae bacterium]|nr:hypothetical protein [Desulfobacteraceae bacterium]
MTIAVYAVPRDKKYIVRNALISDVLGKAKEWLCNLAMKKHSGYKIFEVFFNLGTEQLIIKHN